MIYHEMWLETLLQGGLQGLIVDLLYDNFVLHRVLSAADYITRNQE